MTIHTGHWPTPSGELVAVVREWPDADAARAALANRSTEGLVSATAYEGIDHDGAFTYEQWTSEDAIQDLDGAPVFRLYRRGMAPDYLSLWPVDWFKRDWKIGKSA